MVGVRSNNMVKVLDSYSLEEIASRVGNEIDLQSLVQAVDIRTIPSIRKRLEKEECADSKWCNFTSKNLSKLYWHNRNNHQVIQCMLCLAGKQMESNGHGKIQLKTVPRICHLNGMYLLRMHQNACHGISKGFECMTCKKQYYHKSSLDRHRKLCTRLVLVTQTY